MQLALIQAQQAAAAGEVPVGAVVVCKGQVIGVGHNAPISTHDPSAHAEVVALRAAAQALGNYRLSQCELFVTLEPCAMCAGALINARVKRVVFGANDLKSGAGGSVLNLFENSHLNHHTQVQAGVMAEPCAALLGEFFQNRRKENARLGKARWPLREDALRTPESAFAELPDFAYTPRYISDLPSLHGLRQHYIDEGPSNARAAFVGLHSPAAWGYGLRSFVEQAVQQRARIVVPDMIGFGKSDKPKKIAFHTAQWHRQNLMEFIERLGLDQVTWVVQGDAPWGLPSADVLSGLSISAGEILRLPDDPTLGDPRNSAWRAPFPDAGYRAGPNAFRRGAPATEPVTRRTSP